MLLVWLLATTDECGKSACLASVPGWPPRALSHASAGRSHVVRTRCLDNEIRRALGSVYSRGLPNLRRQQQATEERPYPQKARLGAIACSPGEVVVAISRQKVPDTPQIALWTSIPLPYRCPFFAALPDTHGANHRNAYCCFTGHVTLFRSGPSLYPNEQTAAPQCSACPTCALLRSLVTSRLSAVLMALLVCERKGPAGGGKDAYHEQDGSMPPCTESSKAGHIIRKVRYFS